MITEGLPVSTVVEVSTFFNGSVSDDRIAVMSSLLLANSIMNIGLAVGESVAHDALLSRSDDYNPQAMRGRLIMFDGDATGYVGMVRASRTGRGLFYVQYGGMLDQHQQHPRAIEEHTAVALSRMAAIATANILDDADLLERGGDKVTYTQQELGRLGILMDNILDPCS